MTRPPDYFNDLVSEKLYAITNERQKVDVRDVFLGPARPVNWDSIAEQIAKSLVRLDDEP